MFNLKWSLEKTEKISSIGQEDFDLCFCQICPVPRVYCKHLRFSLEIKLKEWMTRNDLREKLKTLKKKQELRTQLESEKIEKEIQKIEKLRKEINEIRKEENNLLEKEQRNNEQIREIENRIRFLREERKLAEAKRYSLKFKEIEKIKEIGNKIEEEQNRLHDQLQALWETPEIRALSERECQLVARINAAKEIREIEELKKSRVEDQFSLSISQSACSLRVEPISANLKECENCKDKVPIEKIPCAGDEVVVGKEK